MKRKGIHYGWIVCLGGTILTCCAMGLITNAFSVYLPYIIEMRGLSKTAGSSILTVRCLFSFLTMLITDRYYRKLGLRLGTALACLAMGLSFFIYACAQSLFVFYLAAVVSGFAYGVGSMIPVSLLISRWFVRRRAFALSICSCGTGIATVVFPTIITMLVEGQGLTAAFVYEAIFICAMAFLIFLLIRNSPEEKGLSPYGSEEEEILSHDPQHQHPPIRRHYRTRDRILMLAAILLLGAVSTPATAHLSVHFKSFGFDSMLVASAISVFGFVLIVGKCFYGYVADRVGVYHSNYLFFSILMVGLGLSCAAKGGSPLFVFGSLALMATGFPISTIGVSLWASDLTDPENYAQTVKQFQSTYVVGGLAASTLPGILADLTGDYVVTFLSYVVCIGIVLLVVQHMYRHYSREALEKAIEKAKK